MNFLVDHWDIWLALIYAIINVVNAATEHYSKSDGWKRALKFAVEIVSIVASRGEKSGPIPGANKLKVPGTSVVK